MTTTQSADAELAASLLDRDASRLGMWVFLATEVLFFGALFVSFLAYRHVHRDAFEQACRHLDVMLGSINTAVLLTSSLTMALSVHADESGQRRLAGILLASTAVLGAAFLAIKGLEWSREIHEGLWPGPGFSGEGGGGARLFFSLYFLMTGAHALHMIIGMAFVLGVGARCLRRSVTLSPMAVEVLGLYWHFVDIVWIWLFPALYLLGRS